MKKRIIKLMKRTVSSIVAIAVILAGSFLMDTEVKAIDEVKNDKGIVYKEFTDYADYVGKKIPNYTGDDTEGYGYVFGGWFKNTDGKTYTPIATSSEGSGSTVYAKFVPAYVLSVKCQNKAGTTVDTESTSLKVVSSVDSVNYKNYGFELSIITLDKNGNLTNKSVFSSEEDISDKVYEKFKIYDTATDGTLKLQATKAPSDVFGDASAYFTTWSVTGIPKSSYGTIIGVKPYWVTKDGMTVEGLTKYVHVEDGLLHGSGDDTYRYVNVPVNIRDTMAVAAGILKVNYSSCTDFELSEVEGGVVFEEMTWSDNGTSVKLVGNVRDFTSNKTANDIYANLRFKVPSSSASDFSTGYSFAVTDEDFSDNTESQYTNSEYDVWNVKY